LGVVIAAQRQGRADDPRAVLFELRTAGMWLSDAVIARALRIARIKS
jgi:predicted nucleic acid-binding protein